MINALLNLLWFLLGGVWMGLAWWFAGILMVITIIGIPWARSCFVIGTFSFFPFGREAMRRDAYGHEDLGTGALGLIGNILWILIAGWWLALGHLTAAVANFVTIIGIPFAFQHLKLALIAFAPVGSTVVRRDVHARLR